MTKDEYRSRFRLVKWVYFFLFFGVMIPLLALVMAADDWIARRVTWDRGFVFLASTPLCCGTVILGGWVMERVDQRVGRTCSACGRPLFLRCHPERLLASGMCPDCHAPIFSPP